MSEMTTIRDPIRPLSRLRSRHLLSVTDLIPEEVVLLLDTAEAMLKCLGKFERKSLIFKRKQLLCLFGIGRPHNGTFIIR